MLNEGNMKVYFLVKVDVGSSKELMVMTNLPRSSI